MKKKKKTGHDIVKTDVTKGAVTLALENGIRLHIASNKGRFHFHFSGIGDSQIVACPFSHLGEDPKQELAVANEINLFYRDPDRRP
jgi:CRISPR/Cas system-associated endonuclease Cas1